MFLKWVAAAAARLAVKRVPEEWIPAPQTEPEVPEIHPLIERLSEPEYPRDGLTNNTILYAQPVGASYYAALHQVERIDGVMFLQPMEQYARVRDLPLGQTLYSPGKPWWQVTLAQKDERDVAKYVWPGDTVHCENSSDDVVLLRCARPHALGTEVIDIDIPSGRTLLLDIGADYGLYIGDERIDAGYPTHRTCLAGEQLTVLKEAVEPTLEAASSG
jgi:hypothetical protein